MPECGNVVADVCACTSRRCNCDFIHSNIKLETAEKCSCTSRPPSKYPTLKQWRTLKQRYLTRRRILKKSSDSLMTASALVATGINPAKFRTSSFLERLKQARRKQVFNITRRKHRHYCVLTTFLKKYINISLKFCANL